MKNNNNNNDNNNMKLVSRNLLSLLFYMYNGHPKNRLLTSHSLTKDGN